MTINIGMAVDKTSFTQSLMHMVKGNLGTGILAMPASFAHTGLATGSFGLPLLCLIATYCVHLLIKSSRKLQHQRQLTLSSTLSTSSSSSSSSGSSTSMINNNQAFDYATLAKLSFASGPDWMRKFSAPMSWLVDATLLVSQIGVCCVYLIFVADNVVTIALSYKLHLSVYMVFFALYPLTLGLSYIRTLKRLAIASGVANFLQACGVAMLLQYLTRDLTHINWAERRQVTSWREVALGFGSAMFAFEGISVVLPIHSRLARPELMTSPLGLINVSYFILLLLYQSIGVFGYLRFGSGARDSITLNLPPEPIWDVVRAAFALAVLLTYPLQFYVPNEIVWNWLEQKITNSKQNKSSTRQVPTQRAFAVGPGLEDQNKKHLSLASQLDNSTRLPKNNSNELANEHQHQQPQQQHQHQQISLAYEYGCRTFLVTLTFVLAMIVPKLNLLMDLIGSITGTLLSLIIPSMIHIATHWSDSTQCKLVWFTVDLLIIGFGLVAGLSGTTFSLATIIASFR